MLVRMSMAGPGGMPMSSSTQQRSHSTTTGQRLHTAFACSICMRAGPVVPMGKKSSGSSSRQSARWRQSMASYSLVSSTVWYCKSPARTAV